MPHERTKDGAFDEPRALSDADAIASRIAEDEAAADAARHHLRTEPLQPVDLGEEAELNLETGERVWSVRRPAFARRIGASTSALAEAGVLYLTERRLLFQSKVTALSGVDLVDIVEIEVIGERQMLVSLRGGVGFAFEIERPRVFRVELAETLAAARTTREPGAEASLAS